MWLIPQKEVVFAIHRKDITEYSVDALSKLVTRERVVGSALMNLSRVTRRMLEDRVAERLDQQEGNSGTRL